MRKTKVICPKCSGIIPATVESDPTNTGFFHGYYAYCEKCKYPITESEWDEVEILPFDNLNDED